MTILTSRNKIGKLIKQEGDQCTVLLGKKECVIEECFVHPVTTLFKVEYMKDAKQEVHTEIVTSGTNILDVINRLNSTYPNCTITAG